MTPGESVLGAVGASVIMMTKTLAKELGRFKIRVNSVALSLTSDTPTWDRLRDGEGFERDLFTKLVARFPFGRPRPRTRPRRWPSSWLPPRPPR